MLTKRTCLLLGAGASKHLGFPLGGELRSQMLKELWEVKNLRPEQIPDDFKRNGENISLFYDRLAYGSWSSPDACLEKHSEFANVGKYLMCKLLSDIEDIDQITRLGGWYENLVSAINVDHPSKLKDNGLSIVTFNYDRSIDVRLHNYVQHQFGIEPSKAWEILQNSIPIIHVHGMLGKYPDTPYADKQRLYERSQDMKIVSETNGDTVEFRLASKLLNEAERVVVLGFGFADENVKRLNFFKPTGMEHKDVRVANGNVVNMGHVIETRRLMRQCGLEENEHCLHKNCNELFTDGHDPFLAE